MKKDAFVFAISEAARVGMKRPLGALGPVEAK